MLLIAADSAGGSFTVAPNLALVLWTVFVLVFAVAIAFAIRWAIRRLRS